MDDGILIRHERSGDAPEIRRVHEAAFGGPGEMRLVDAIRDAHTAVAALVAEERGAVVGHILFSPVTIESESGIWTAVGLAPLAVLPGHQRRGIGAKLIRAGLEALRTDGHEVVFVLGHPSYYPRFAFGRADRFGLRWEHPCPPEAFMMLELRPGAIAGRSGIVRFRPEFEGL